MDETEKKTTIDGINGTQPPQERVLGGAESSVGIYKPEAGQIIDGEDSEDEDEDFQPFIFSNLNEMAVGGGESGSDDERGHEMEKGVKDKVYDRFMFDNGSTAEQVPVIKSTPAAEPTRTKKPKKKREPYASVVTEDVKIVAATTQKSDLGEMVEYLDWITHSRKRTNIDMRVQYCEFIERVFLSATKSFSHAQTSVGDISAKLEATTRDLKDCNDKLGAMLESVNRTAEMTTKLYDSCGIELQRE